MMGFWGGCRAYQKAQKGFGKSQTVENSIAFGKAPEREKSDRMISPPTAHHPQGSPRVVRRHPKTAIFQPTHGSSAVGGDFGDSTRDPRHWLGGTYRRNNWNRTWGWTPVGGYRSKPSFDPNPNPQLPTPTPTAMPLPQPEDVIPRYGGEGRQNRKIHWGIILSLVGHPISCFWGMLCQ